MQIQTIISGVVISGGRNLLGIVTRKIWNEKEIKLENLFTFTGI